LVLAFEKEKARELDSDLEWWWVMASASGSVTYLATAKELG
jgi:hypothetical protein